MLANPRLSQQPGFVAMAVLLSGATLAAALLPALRHATPSIAEPPRPNVPMLEVRATTAVVELPRVFVVSRRSLAGSQVAAKRAIREI